MSTKAQLKTLKRIGSWRVTGSCEGDVWICKQSRICKVFSRIDEKGGLYCESRKTVVKAFGKAEAVRLVDEAFS